MEEEIILNREIETENKYLLNYFKFDYIKNLELINDLNLDCFENFEGI
jgi:hypothetical protein